MNKEYLRKKYERIHFEESDTSTGKLKQNYAKWLEKELIKQLNIPVVVGQSEQLFCKCGFEKKGNTVPCIRTDCDNLLIVDAK